MVEIVEQWDDFEAVADRCRYGIYQIEKNVDGVEVRVMAGRFGYIGVFRDEKDPLLERMLHYCKTRRFIKIRGSIRDEYFFTAPEL